MINIMMLQRVCILFSVLILQSTKKHPQLKLYFFAKGYFDAFFLFSFLPYFSKNIIIFRRDRVFLTIIILYSTRLYFWKGFEGFFVPLQATFTNSMYCATIPEDFVFWLSKLHRNGFNLNFVKRIVMSVSCLFSTFYFV